jgi:hypothetical protein
MLIWRISDGRIGHERYHETLEGFVTARIAQISPHPLAAMGADIEVEKNARGDGGGVDIRFYRIGPTVRQDIYPGYYASQIRVHP